MMKTRYILLSVTALLLALTGILMTSCDRNGDDPVSSGQQQPDNTGDNALHIVASKQPFMSETGTRAGTDLGGTTTFENGDEIGIIAVKDGAVLAGCNNVKLTYNSADGTWAGDDIFYDNGATYIAYSPYRAVMNGKTSAQEIFDAFVVADVQNTAALFAANDLMIDDSGTADKTTQTLTFTFEHKLALLEIPGECVRLHARTTNGKRYPIQQSMLINRLYINGDLYGIKNALFRLPTGTQPYRYLLKPTTWTELGLHYEIQTTPDNISYALATWKTTASITFVAGERRKIFPTKTRDVALGDLYYADGSIYPRNMAIAISGYPPSDGCIGVVFATGATGINNGDDISYYSGTGLTGAIGGYVLALVSVTAVNQDWSSVFTIIGTSTSNTDYLGYSNTKKIKGMPGYSESTYPICWDATSFGVTVPSNSSGWYLPSAGQLQTIWDNKAKLESAITKVGGSKLSDDYFSSSEGNSNPANRIWYLDIFYDRGVAETLKSGMRCNARSVFTF